MIFSEIALDVDAPKCNNLFIFINENGKEIAISITIINVNLLINI